MEASFNLFCSELVPKVSITDSIELVVLSFGGLGGVVCLFWEGAQVWAGKGQRERGRESRASSVLSEEPDTGLDLTNREIMTWAKINSQMLNRLSHPGAPGCHSFLRSHPSDFAQLKLLIFFHWIWTVCTCSWLTFLLLLRKFGEVYRKASSISCSVLICIYVLRDFVAP